MRKSITLAVIVALAGAAAKAETMDQFCVFTTVDWGNSGNFNSGAFTDGPVGWNGSANGQYIINSGASIAGIKANGAGKTLLLQGGATAQIAGPLVWNGSVNLQNGTILGDIDVGGNFTLAGGTVGTAASPVTVRVGGTFNRSGGTIHGAVICKTVGTNTGGTVTGGVTTATPSTTPFTTVALLASQFADQSTLTTDIPIPAGGVVDLTAPAAHGALGNLKGAVNNVNITELRLSAGEYRFNSFNFSTGGANNVKVYLDTRNGPIRILVKTGNLNFNTTQPLFFVTHGTTLNQTQITTSTTKTTDVNAAAGRIYWEVLNGGFGNGGNFDGAFIGTFFFRGATQSLTVNSSGRLFGRLLSVQPLSINGKVFCADFAGTPPPPPNQAPTANAGQDQSASACPGATAAVTLDGSNSSDPEGSITYAWSIGGTTIATGPTPTVNLGIGTHTITLTVSDSATPPATATDTVTITVSAALVADAGTYPQVIWDGAPPPAITLDGSASLGAATFAWTQTSGPAVTLLDANTATPTFEPAHLDGFTTYAFELTVTGAGCTDTDTAQVTVKHENEPPLANAGDDQPVDEGALVTLAGTGSDGDDDPLTFVWSQTCGPTVTLDPCTPAEPCAPGSATFFAPTIAGPHACPPATVVLCFTLTADDGLETSTDEVLVTVTDVNRAPENVDAGPDASACENDDVTLTGSATDPDGDGLTFTWTRIAGTAGGATLSGAAPTFTVGPVPVGGETLTYQLTVSDASVPGDACALETDGGTVDIVLKHENRAPVADAGGEVDCETVPELTLVSLSGADSTDPDGDPIASYQWTQASSDVHQVTLTGANTVSPTFTTPDVGPAGATLHFTLVVTDAPAGGSCDGTPLASAPDTIEVCVAYVNTAPIADAGGDQTVLTGTTVTLDGSGSFDLDGNPLTFAWTQLSGPTVTLSSDSAEMPTFVPSTAGAREFLLTVSDPFGGSDTDTVLITVNPAGPVILPPDCTNARPSADMLWPPNHHLVAISILGVTDASNTTSIAILGVTQDEPTNAQGDGDTSPDAFIQGSTVLIRAERAGPGKGKGGGNGRVYRIAYRAQNSAGTCSGTVTVCVPHDQKKPVTCIDDGGSYDSTKP